MNPLPILQSNLHKKISNTLYIEIGTKSETGLVDR